MKHEVIWNIAFPSDGTSHDLGPIADFHTALFVHLTVAQLVYAPGKKLSVNVKRVYFSPRTQRSNTT